MGDQNFQVDKNVLNIMMKAKSQPRLGLNVEGYLREPYPTGDKNPRIDRAGKDYMDIFLKISPALSCKVFSSLSENENANTSFKKVLKNIKSPLRFENVGFGNWQHNATLFFNVGNKESKCFAITHPAQIKEVGFENTCEAFIDVKYLTEESCFFGSFLPPPVYINVKGIVQWISRTEETYFVSGQGERRNLCKALIGSSNRCFQLTVWQESIPLLKDILAKDKQREIKISSVTWKLFNDEWKLETTLITKFY